MPTNPGSTEAKRLGCTCPVLDNQYGEGVVVDGKLDPNQFFVDPECPIHVDERRLHAQPGGEGVGGGATTEVRSLVGDDSDATPASASPGESAGEGESASTLPGVDAGRTADTEVRGEATGGKQGDGPAGQRAS